MTIEEVRKHLKHAHHMANVRPEDADKDLARAFIELIEPVLEEKELEVFALTRPKRNRGMSSEAVAERRNTIRKYRIEHPEMSTRAIGLVFDVSGEYVRKLTTVS